ncbi:MAG TPA: hypothetical protein VFS31_13270, partial [Chitinophagaceae bacterium]|nr:hypothetical protein [Chitinophagaceae bacterium]
MRKLSILLVLFMSSFISKAQLLSPFDGMLDNSPSANSFPLFSKGKAAGILVDVNDSKTVVLANGLFADDMERVTGHRPAIQHSLEGTSAYCVIAGSIEENKFIQSL